jgi:hypothetical protein
MMEQVIDPSSHPADDEAVGALAMPMQIKLFTRPLAGSPSGLVEIEQVINAWLAEYPAIIVTHTETHVFFNQESRKNDIVVLIWYRS